MNLLFTCCIQFVQTDLAGQVNPSFIDQLGGYLPMELLLEGMFYCNSVVLEL